ncbi:unnamed protein product [Mytilus coruscus]|uniref:Ig-like domain-containing protein n=1 Tax=Mytilus coruscus TaxID=42192 RepID=A0A6J8AD46_MYTCO|nr:unnamed protein product [Mytilus coruscus]
MEVPNVAIQRTFYTVHLNGTITLECQVTGIPPAFNVQWQKELGNTTMDLTSNNANKYNGSTPDTPSLTIFNAEYSEHGVYRCTARNNYSESPRIYLKLTVEQGEFRLLMSSFGCHDNYEKETEKAIKALSADFSDFVIYCSFEGRQCNERVIASEAGIRLSIHEPGSQPYLENNGISVATGFRTDISLVQKKIERMPGTTVCDASNKFSNFNACFEECVERNVKEKCNCLLTFPYDKTNLYTCKSQGIDL